MRPRYARAQVIVFLIWVALSVVGAATRDTPAVSVWFVWGALGALLVLLGLAFSRWSNGRVPRETPRD